MIFRKSLCHWRSIDPVGMLQIPPKDLDCLSVRKGVSWFQNKDVIPKIQLVIGSKNDTNNNLNIPLVQQKLIFSTQLFWNQYPMYAPLGYKMWGVCLQVSPATMTRLTRRPTYHPWNVAEIMTAIIYQNSSGGELMRLECKQTSLHVLLLFHHL